MKNQPFYQTTAKFIAALMIVMLVLAALPAAPARAAATRTWDGLTTGGVWTVATNWSDDTAPVDTDDVIISSTFSGTITDVPTISLTSLTISGNTILQGTAAPLTVTGALTVASGKILTLGFATTVGSLTGTGTITNSAAVTLTISNTASTTFSGVISNGTGALSLTKTGAGTLTLSGANTYTGLTTISAGTLKLGTAGSGANTPLGTIGLGTTVTAGAALDLNGFTLATAEALTLNGTGISSTGALTNSSATTVASYSGAITLATASSIVTNPGGITLTGAISGAFPLTLGGTGAGSISSIIGTGTGTLTKEGAGTWTLSGLNTYTGLTTISAGILQLGAAGVNPDTPLGTTGAGTIVAAAGAALDLNGFTLATSEVLTLNGTGISTTGALTNSSSTAASYSGAITLAAASSIVTNPGGITLTGAISGEFPLTLGGTGAGSISSNIVTGTGTLTKEGAGTWILSGANTYTGLTTISAGTLKLGAAASPLGTVAAGTTVAAGAALDLNGFTLGTAEALTLNGTGIALGGALTNSSSTAASYSGLITLGAASSIVTNSGGINITHAGPITGAFGLTLGGSGNGSLASILGTTTAAGTLTKDGAGTWTLSGANTFEGGTTLNAGKLNINHATAIGTGIFTILGGTIDNTSGSANTLTTNNVQNWNGDFTFTGTSDLNLGTGAVILFGGNRQVTVVNAVGTLTVGGAITPDNISLTKAGAGTLSLGPGAVSLHSLTIGAGTLISTSAPMSLRGNFTNNGIFTHTSGTVVFNGTAAQTIGGSTAPTFYDLTISNFNGITLGSNATINHTLTFTDGRITTGSHTLFLPTTGHAGSAKQGSYVYGNVQSAFSSGALSFTFPIGDASTYAPVLLEFTGAGTSGSVTAAVSAAACGAPGIDQSKNVNHCWTLTNDVSGGVGTSFDDYDATFTFAGTGFDSADAGATKGSFIVGKLDSATWTYPILITNAGGFTTKAADLLTMSSFEVGEAAQVPADKYVKGSDTNKAVSAFTLSNATSTTVTGMIVTVTGTAPASVAAVKIYLDNNANNEYDAGDTLKGTAAYVSPTATFTGLTIAVTSTVTPYLITLDIIVTPTDGQTMAALVTGETTPVVTHTHGSHPATLTVDSILPTIVISAPSVASTTLGPVTYTVTYADAHFNASTLATGNITLNKTGTANGTLAVTAPTTLTRTVTISSITGSGTLGISIAAGTASDLAGNLTLAAGPSTTFIVAGTTTTITNAAALAATPTLVGQSYAVNFTVTAASGTPTGSVTVSDGTDSCTGALAAGAGTCNLTSTTAGVKTLTATYAGVAPFNGSSGTATHTVTGVTITTISPTSGSISGGTSVTITGTNFTGATAVTFGGTAAASFVVVSATQITAVTPAHATGTVDVSVTTATGTGTKTGAFTFGTLPTVTAISPISGPISGGTSVTITGTNFTGATAVTFGGTAATSIVVVSATQITAVTPAHATGTVDVSVTTPAGTGTKASAFTFGTPPTITSLSPSSATAGGAAFTLTVTGTNFVTGAKVNWNGTERVTTYVSSTQLTAAITAADILAVGVPYVTVVNPAPEAGTSNQQPFFISTTGAAVTSSTTVTGTDLPVTNGTVTATPTGTGTVTVAQYTTDPGGAPTFVGYPQYYDVHISGTFSSLTITFCGITDDTNHSIYFWNGAAWVAASSQTYNSTTDCVTVIVNTTTTPTLVQLSGAVFASNNKIATTTTIITDVPDPSVPTQAVSVSVTVSSTSGTPPGTVAITGADTNCTITLSAGSGSCSVIFASAGSKTLTATYTGDTTFLGSLDTESHVVTTTATFSDVPNTYWAWTWIERLYSAGVTSGCMTTPLLLYCPDNYVTRAEMAKFLLIAKHGTGYVPPAVGTSTGFSDVPTTYWAAAWIKQLAAEGITTGCTATTYCPDNYVTRAEMAKFLLTAVHISGYTPPAVGTSTGFTDVATTHWAAAWIKQLATEGITTGCTVTTYCPNSSVTRAEMAKFLVAAFNLP